MKSPLYLFGIVIVLSFSTYMPVFAEDEEKDQVEVYYGGTDNGLVNAATPGDDDDVNIYGQTAAAIENNKKQN